MAGSAEPPSAPFRVGEWLVEPAWNHIRRNGETVKLEPRVMRLLKTLAAAAGQPMTREQLLGAIWPNVLVNEEALSRAVSQLRRALGDDPKNPRYIQTVHKGGYSLVLPVRVASAKAANQDGAAAPVRPTYRLAAGVMILCLGLAAVLLHRALEAPSPRSPNVHSLTPLTSSPGREIDPGISSNGRRVVYAASTAEGYDLFMQDIDGGAPVRLTASAAAELHPVWSPEGDRIAFVSGEGDAAAIYLLSVRDRKRRKLVDLQSWSFGLDWSPDGRTIAYSEAAAGEAATIVLRDIVSGSMRVLADSPGSASHVKPVFSPDGKRLAFIRSAPLDRQQIVVVALEGGEAPRTLGLVPQQIRGLDWYPDGRALIFSGKSGRRFDLWSVSADGAAAPEALPTKGGDLFNPSVSANGLLVAEEVEQDSDVWLANLEEGGARPFIRSTWDDYDPAYSLDGSRIAFVSERSGTPEIWLQSASGLEDARRLTRLGGARPGSIFWSPNGKRLAFALEEEEFASIHLVEVAGGRSTRLIGDSRNHAPVGWSDATGELYILSAAAGEWELQRLDPHTGRVRPVLQRVRAASMSRDRRSIFVLTGEGNRLLRIVPGKGFVQQFRLPGTIAGPDAIHAAENLLYLIKDNIIYRLDLADGSFAPAKQLSDYWGGASSLSPDGKSLIYTRGRETGNDLVWLTLTPEGS